ncbi:hypothetical protein ABGB18_32260 [Nonomuraea sp. B12E4]|uniref:hypothetical protein n=1 Tax=Nonomuraea sp. B12E4 TaxID=3153564 RepID=UPI00325D5F32
MNTDSEYRQRVPPQLVLDLGAGAGGRAEVAIPAQPVGGARDDGQQGTFGHAPFDRGRQPFGLGIGALAMAALEGGHAALVDDQVGVVEVAGVQVRSRSQVGVLEMGDETGGGVGQPDLLAEGSQFRLALRPGQQVGAPVGVLA